MTHIETQNALVDSAVNEQTRYLRVRRAVAAGVEDLLDPAPDVDKLRADASRAASAAVAELVEHTGLSEPIDVAATILYVARRATEALRDDDEQARALLRSLSGQRPNFQVVMIGPAGGGGRDEEGERV